VSNAPIRRLTIATRESALALVQAGHVRARLATLYPEAAVELLGVTTQGDRVLDRSLAEIGGKGLFIKELELALSDGRADLAVHSLKDVPMEVPEGFTLAAISEREDPRDAFVSNRYLDLAGLPGGARIGTSSPRRQAQLRERDPLLSIQPLRGNVNTRLAKLDQGRYDAIVLAAAGLRRLGLAARIASLLDPEECLPAVGQGALALECRADRADIVAALRPPYKESGRFQLVPGPARVGPQPFQPVFQSAPMYPRRPVHSCFDRGRPSQSARGAPVGDPIGPWRLGDTRRLRAEPP